VTETFPVPVFFGPDPKKFKFYVVFQEFVCLFVFEILGETVVETLPSYVIDWCGWKRGGSEAKLKVFLFDVFIRLLNLLLFFQFS
jgi:hypothetical protein